MGLYSNRPDRLVIPRWRDFKETAKAKELSKDKDKNTPTKPIVSIQKQIDNWSKNNNVINAIELVNSAFIINELAAALAAANFILNNCKDDNHPSLQIAKLILKKEIEATPSDKIANSFDTLHIRIGCKIQETRKYLNGNPHNTIQWVDLARWYCAIGKLFEAERCIKTAIQLTPNNIFVIRSAVRFFIHKHIYDKKGEDSLGYALQLIRKNPATKFDPWLMATEISLCAYLDKTSRLIKNGFSLIEAKNFSPFMLSELSAAIATEEMNHGSNNSARKLFTTSLIDPNENTIAQAQWAKTHITDIPLNLTTTNSFEANSYNHYYLEDWEKSFSEALNWIVDQPFSREPVNHASFMAGAIIDNNALSVKICDFGLRANPKEFTLLNNKTYSLAVENKLEEAEKSFSQIDFEKIEEAEKIAYLATKGLLNYRKGNFPVGSDLYDQAEALARKNKDERTAFRVKIYKTRAEFICGCNTNDEKTAIENLVKESEQFKHPDIQRTIDNLKVRMGLIGTPADNKTKIITL